MDSLSTLFRSRKPRTLEFLSPRCSDLAFRDRQRWCFLTCIETAPVVIRQFFTEPLRYVTRTRPDERRWISSPAARQYTCEASHRRSRSITVWTETQTEALVSYAAHAAAWTVWTRQTWCRRCRCFACRVGVSGENIHNQPQYEALSMGNLV